MSRRRPAVPCGGDEPGQDIPDTTRQEAAELAASIPAPLARPDGCQGGRGHHRGEEYLKANGAKPGMVLYEVAHHRLHHSPGWAGRTAETEKVKNDPLRQSLRP